MSELATEPEVVKEVIKAEIPCPHQGCKVKCRTERGLKSHLTRAHDGKRPGKKKSEREPKETRPHYEDAILTPGNISPATVLETVFPDGIPPHKIAPAIEWVLATHKLNGETYA